MGYYIKYAIYSDGLHYQLIKEGKKVGRGPAGYSRSGYGEDNSLDEPDEPDEPDKFISGNLVIPVAYLNYNEKYISDTEWISRVNVRLYRYFLTNEDQRINDIIKSSGFCCHLKLLEENTYVFLKGDKELNNILEKLLQLQICIKGKEKRYKYYLDYYNKTNVIPTISCGSLSEGVISDEIKSIYFDLWKYIEFYINSKFKISKGLFKLEVEYGEIIIRAPIAYYEYKGEETCILNGSYVWRKFKYSLIKDSERKVIYRRKLNLYYYHARTLGCQIDFNDILRNIEQLLPEIYEACNNFKDNYSKTQINLMESLFYETNEKVRLKSFNTISKGIKSLCYKLSKMIRENKFYGLQYDFCYKESHLKNYKGWNDGAFYVRFYIPYYIKKDDEICIDKLVIRECSFCYNNKGCFDISILLNPEPIRYFYSLINNKGHFKAPYTHIPGYTFIDLNHDNIREFYNKIKNKKTKYKLITGNYEEIYEQLCKDFFNSISGIEVKRNNFKKALELKDTWIKKIEEEDYEIEAIIREKEEKIKLELELERKKQIESNIKAKKSNWWKKIKNIFT